MSAWKCSKCHRIWDDSVLDDDPLESSCADRGCNGELSLTADSETSYEVLLLPDERSATVFEEMDAFREAEIMIADLITVDLTKEGISPGPGEPWADVHISEYVNGVQSENGSTLYWSLADGYAQFPDATYPTARNGVVVMAPNPLIPLRDEIHGKGHHPVAGGYPVQDGDGPPYDAATRTGMYDHD